MAFLDSVDSTASLLIFRSPSLLRIEPADLPTGSPYLLGRAQPTARSVYPPVSPLLSIESRWYRNLHLLSIAYAFRPRLRSRLTLSGRAFLRKPWVFDGQVSHLPLVTHANILSCVRSTRFHNPTSLRTHCSPTMYLSTSKTSVVCFSPGYFRRKIPGPVSYYALFKCMAASKPTSWLSMQSHILFHLTYTWGP